MIACLAIYIVGAICTFGMGRRRADASIAFLTALLWPLLLVGALIVAAGTLAGILLLLSAPFGDLASE